MIDYSNKGSYAAQVNTEDEGDPRDVQIGKDYEEHLRNQGSIRYENGEVTVGSDSFSYEAPTEGSLPGDMSTVRTKSGSYISDMTEIQPDNIIDIEGQTMEISTALRLGFLCKDGNGNIYSKKDGRPGSKQAEDSQLAREQAEDNHTDYEVNFKGDHCSEQLQSMKSRSDGVDQMVTKVFSSVVDGTDSTEAVKELSQAIGADPNSVAEVLNETLNDTLEGIAQYASAKFGVDIPVDEFVDNIFSKWSPARIKSALLAGYYNSTRDIDKHIEFYMLKDRSPHAPKKS